MTRKRGRQEMCVDALRAIRGGETSVYGIMHAANLSWTPLVKEILPRLIKEELVVESVPSKGRGWWARRRGRRRRAYAVTGKGNAVVAAQDEIVRCLGL